MKMNLNALTKEECRHDHDRAAYNSSLAFLKQGAFLAQKQRYAEVWVMFEDFSTAQVIKWRTLERLKERGAVTFDDGRYYLAKEES